MKRVGQEQEVSSERRWRTGVEGDGGGAAGEAELAWATAASGRAKEGLLAAEWAGLGPGPAVVETALATKRRTEGGWTAGPIREASRVKVNWNLRSGFVHSNFVPGPLGPRSVMLAEGPKPGSLAHWWETIWHNRVLLIAMVNPLSEGKVAPYWSPAIGVPLKFASLKVTTMNIEVVQLAHKTMYRTMLRVERGSQIRRLRHFSYLVWPDGRPGGLHSARSLLNFTLELHHEQVAVLRSASGRPSPLLIHCSDGLGRSAVVAALLLAWHRLRSPSATPSVSTHPVRPITQRLSIPDIVFQLRAARAGAIPSLRHYLFLHLALLQGVALLVTPNHPHHPIIDAASHHLADAVRKLSLPP